MFEGAREVGEAREAREADGEADEARESEGEAARPALYLCFTEALAHRLGVAMAREGARVEVASVRQLARRLVAESGAALDEGSTGLWEELSWRAAELVTAGRWCGVVVESCVVADTFLRFKGLERAAVIVTDLRLVETKREVRMHVALTRALVTARVVAARGVLEGWGMGEW